MCDEYVQQRRHVDAVRLLIIGTRKDGDLAGLPSDQALDDLVPGTKGAVRRSVSPSGASAKMTCTGDVRLVMGWMTGMPSRCPISVRSFTRSKQTANLTESPTVPVACCAQASAGVCTAIIDRVGSRRQRHTEQ